MSANCTSRPARSMPLTVASCTVTFGCSWNRSRSGWPTADGLEQVGGDLVQERLERVVVVLVDQRDVDVGVLELPGRTDAPEATAEDDHVRTLACRWVRSPSGGSVVPCHWLLAPLLRWTVREFARRCRHPHGMRSGPGAGRERDWPVGRGRTRPRPTFCVR